jgi:hypothetical protein
MKHIKSMITTVFMAVFLCLASGCSTIMQSVETLGDYVSENPVFASVVTRQAVARYIGAKDTAEERQARAEDVTRRINKVALYLEGNPETTVDALMITIDAAIDWDELNPEDRMLVADIVMLVEAELRQYEVENDPIDSTALIAIKGLFDVAISAAQLYLLKV